MSRKGCLYVFVGPSGVGKNTIMNRVREAFPEMRQLPTATTREKREGEVEGVHHFFVTLEHFNAMREHGDLLEAQEVHPGKFYGVPRSSTVRVLQEGGLWLADIDIFGAEALKAAFPDNVVTIFVTPPSLEVLTERLEERHEQDIEARLKRVELELSHARFCDHQVVNDDLERCVAEVIAIVTRGC